MQTFLLMFMGLGLVLPLGLFLLGSRHVRQCYCDQTQGTSPFGPESMERRPRAAVIVPLTGHTPAMKSGLESLLNQHYPNLAVILVTQDQEDPATALVREVMAGRQNVRHVVSGPARGSSQKNHNLLAGLKALEADAEILVFCDSGHQAPLNLLSALISPIAQGKAVATTCFHRVFPGDLHLGTLAMLITVLTIHLMQSLSFLAQPWGGATAVSRRVFDALNVKGLWAGNVVDDVSLGVRLLRQRRRVYPVPGICLRTEVRGLTVRDLMAWITRQLLYLKYCCPVVWLAALPGALVLVGPFVVAGLAGLGALWGLTSWTLAAMGLGYLLLFTLLGAWYRRLAPPAIPLRRWLPALYAAVFIAGASYLKTWFTDTISWRGVSYRVTWGGGVREIRR